MQLLLVECMLKLKPTLNKTKKIPELKQTLNEKNILELFKGMCIASARFAKAAVVKS